MSSDKKLFDIFDNTKNVRKWIIGIIVCLFLVLFLCVFFKRGFLEFHGEEQYKPKNDIGKGLYGKINLYLDSALMDTALGHHNLKDKYRRLKFYYPCDTASYLVNYSEVRLVYYSPNRGNKEECAFFYNSEFKKLLEKQRANLSVQFFKIEWDESHARIKRITVDDTQGNMALHPNRWKGEIHIEDPFHSLDENVIYVVHDNYPIPLFSSNLPTSRFTGGKVNVSDRDSALLCRDLNRWNRGAVSDFVDLHNCLNKGEESGMLKLLFDSNHYFELFNRGDSIYFRNCNLGVEYWIDGVKKNVLTSSLNRFSTAFRHTVKIQLSRYNQSKTIYLVKKVFNVVSKPANEGIAGMRLHQSDEFADLFLKQEIQGLESNLKTTSSKKITLSTNSLLSKMIESEMRRYVNETLRIDTTITLSDDDEFQMSFCLMDINTGEVIAAPYYSTRFDQDNLKEKETLSGIRNFNFEQHHIGSTFKPLLAFAAAAKYPSLANFRLTNFSIDIPNKSFQILGYHGSPAYGYDEKKKPNDLFWGHKGNLDRKQFLSISHDNYPIALAMLALTENDVPEDNRAFQLLNQRFDNEGANNLFGLFENPGNGNRIRYRSPNVTFNGIGASSFANLLSNLYDIKTEESDWLGNSFSYDSTTWRAERNLPVLYSLYPDQTNLRLNLVHKMSDFENFVLGQGNNMWSNIKLAEAYSRLLSKQKVKASFLKSNEHFEGWFDNVGAYFDKKNRYTTGFARTGQEMNNAWVSFMTDWQHAVETNEFGTSSTLHNAFTQFRQIPNSGNYHFYCKTGTPENEGFGNTTYINGKTALTKDQGMFVFGITNQNSNAPSGVVGVVYINHIANGTTKKNLIMSMQARDFLTKSLYNKLIQYNYNRINRR